MESTMSHVIQIYNTHCAIKWKDRTPKRIKIDITHRIVNDKMENSIKGRGI